MDLNEARKTIDAIDQDIVRLFEQRLAVSEQIAIYKKRIIWRSNSLQEKRWSSKKPLIDWITKLIVKISRLYLKR